MSLIRTSLPTLLVAFGSLAGAACDQPTARAISCKTVSPDGQCVVITQLYPGDPSGLSPVVDLVVESGSVYWTSTRYGRLLEIGVDGGTPVTLVTGLDQPWGIAATPTTVYWTDYNSAFLQGNAVYQAAVDGGTPSLLVPMAENPVSIAVDATNVYWTEAAKDGAFGNLPNSGSILSRPIAGGDVSTLASGLTAPWALAVNASGLFWVDVNPSGFGSPGTSTIKTVSLTGGSPTALASGQSVPAGEPPRTIAVDATHVYWLSGDTAASGGSNHDGAVITIPIGGGSPAVLASGQVRPSAIAIDAAFVYWVNLDGRVMKVPLGGGTPSTLADRQPGPGAIAVDETSVYWGNYDGSVVKLTPK